MPKISAGLLIYRKKDGRTEVLLVHPGGPIWARRDEGAWSISKGEVDPEEDLLAAARREVKEETGFEPHGEFVSLGNVTQKSGKVVHAWAVPGDFDAGRAKSNLFEMEWPPRSGRKQAFPEADRAEYFDIATARRKINPAQIRFLEEMDELA